jgi:hypothetical protein
MANETGKTNRLDELKAELKAICEKTDTRLSGMEFLIKYYIKSLGWTEEQAYEYAIGLFHNGTISQIKLFGKDGEEL